MLDILQVCLKSARRAENGGVITMGALSPAVWTAMSKRLWRLQVTSKETLWRKELADILYEASRGLVALAVRGFFEAQRLVIGTGNEELTSTVVRAGATEAIILSNSTLDWSIDQNTIENKWLSFKPKTPYQTKPTIDVRISTDIQEPVDNDCAKKLYDPERPQHPEFAERLSKLQKFSKLIPDRCLVFQLQDVESSTN
ncbi:MAG: hypothetical protein OEZ39_20540, partial [Gammaproteobacteria bacterium]|nr:hypothetical protein [Gammaproteobacteria bacterium]